MVTKERKLEIIEKFGTSDNDTGSTEIQIATLTERVSQISNHLKAFPKDKHSRAGLLKLIGKRRRLFRYLKKNNRESYTSLMSDLGK